MGWGIMDSRLCGNDRKKGEEMLKQVQHDGAGLADAEFLAGGAEFGQDFFFMIYVAVDHNGFAVAKDIRNARRIRRINHMGSQICVGR